MRQLKLECIIDLPPDALDHGDITELIKDLWRDIESRLTERGVKFQQQAGIIEIRTRPGPKPGGKRKREPKVTPPPHISLAPEAAE